MDGNNINQLKYDRINKIMLFITYLGLQDIDNLSDNTLTKKEVINKINNFLIDEFEVDESKIKPNANLRDILNLGSLDYVDLIILAERNFDFTAKEKDFRNIKTLNDFYGYCYNRTNIKHQ